MADSYREIFEAWRRKAEEDYSAAGVLFANNGPPATICFLCQQTAEKYLKAFVLLHGQPLKRIHQVDILLEDALALDPQFRDLMESAIFLKRYYTASRYPDDIPEDVAPDKAEEALRAASRIRDMVLAKVASSA